MFKNYYLIAGLLALTVGLTACDGASSGFTDESEELAEVVAIKGFYQAIYVDGNLEKAKQFASNRMDGLIDHYATVNGVQRYVLDRYFDSVEISVAQESLVPYLNNKQEMRATVVFDGTYQGDTAKDRRDVVLVQEQGKWRVDQILDPRYRP